MTATAGVQELLSERARNLSDNRPQPARPGVISFAAGFPDPASLPFDGIAAATNRAMTTHGEGPLQYGPAFGYAGLLDLLVEKLGRDQGVKYPGGTRIPTDDEARDLIHAAADLGITLVDTAPAYGTSEARLGALLAGQRDRWTIITKVGEEFVDGKSRFDFSAAAVRSSVERSLARLRTDRVECVLIHSDGVIENMPAMDEAIDELESLKARGLVRSFGASTKTVTGGLRTLDRCDVVMVTLNLAAGDTLLIPPGTAHCVTATGDEPLYILCCCSPAYAHEDTELL